MRRKIFSCLTALALTACTSITSVHEDCVQASRDFLAQANCVQNLIAADPHLKGDPLAQEYSLTAAELEKEVKTGQITDSQAQLQLTHKLNEINNLRLQDDAALNEASEPPYPGPVFVGGYYHH